MNSNPGRPAAGAPEAEESAGDLERNLRAALVDSRQRYKDLVEISSDFAWETDAEGAFAFVSPRGALGYPAGALVGREAASFVVEPRQADSLPFAARQPVERAEVWFRRADGELALLVCACLPLLDAQGRWCGARGVSRDITEERAGEVAFARSQNLGRQRTHALKAIWDQVDPKAMLPAAAEAVMRALSAEASWIYRSEPGGQRILAAEAGGRPGIGTALPAALDEAETAISLHHGGMQLLVAATHTKAGADGLLCVCRERGRPAWDEDEQTLLADIARQIGIAMIQVANHEALERLSKIDGLTGLLIRRAFLAEAGQCLDGPGAMLYIDLDNFKPVNDLHGHEAGDEALRQTAKILIAAAGGRGIPARIGGDEFALWLPGADAKAAKAAARALGKAAGALSSFSARDDIPLGFSIGIAIYEPASRETIEPLLARADAAMYEAKRGGKGDVRLASAGPGKQR
ncbi:MAG: diguanylate cyclase domain-containing protein [Alphaproteobacteria bacterium]